MAKYPSNIALAVSSFLVNVNTWRYTSGGLTNINIIKSASISLTSVTDAQYEQYTIYTAWRFETWEQHNALTL